MSAHPACPETLEGWYVHHQILSVTNGQLRNSARSHDAEPLEAAMDAARDGGGWSVAVSLIGSRSELMLVHARPTLDAIGEVQRRVLSVELMNALRTDYAFLSVTEAGLYHLTAQFGNDPDELARRITAERDTPHVQRRLYPPIPEGMPYVCFYPMSKRRDTGQNWYTLSLAERSQLMRAHGEVGRRYAGRIVQVITGAIGLDAWEWGVTLFARDPLDFKKLVTDMRFDETSAKYAEFGAFYVGKVTSVGEWLR